jgi:hypothetical protein
MKKLMALMIGMSLAFGSATLLADGKKDPKKDTTPKSDTKKDDKNSNPNFGKKVEPKTTNEKKDK